jgi:hypothetical protein
MKLSCCLVDERASVTMTAAFVATLTPDRATSQLEVIETAKKSSASQKRGCIASAAHS